MTMTDLYARSATIRSRMTADMRRVIDQVMGYNAVLHESFLNEMVEAGMHQVDNLLIVPPHATQTYSLAEIRDGTGWKRGTRFAVVDE